MSHASRSRASAATARTSVRLLLAGGGHSHLAVLRHFAAARESGLAITLVSPEPTLIYSGMLPGVVAGHYAVDEARIALSPLAAEAGVRLITGEVAALDLASRTARLASGASIAFDLLSLNVGSTPQADMPGAREHAIPARPFETLLAAWQRILDEPHPTGRSSIAVIGGGAGGVELVLAMQHRLRVLGRSNVRCTLISDTPRLLPGHTPGVGRRLARACARSGIAVHLDSRVRAFSRGCIELDDGRRLEACHAFLATGAAAAPWWHASGLGCDERGFVRVDAMLRSTTHPFVFAAGDCASLQHQSLPKSGLHAVRQGPVLARNLRSVVTMNPLVAFRPPRRWLALIGTGGDNAVLSYGPLATEGSWVWRWKQHIDRRHVSRHTLPDTTPEGAGSAGD